MNRKHHNSLYAQYGTNEPYQTPREIVQKSTPEILAELMRRIEVLEKQLAERVKWHEGDGK